ncbi:MAG: alpha/beta fold hydrolase [Acidimicrobiales bacterium]
MPTATVRGIEVHYRRSGAGPRLLLITGTGSSLRESAVLLEPFAEVFDLLAYDQRGLGETTVPDRPPTMADYAADAAALADSLGWNSFRVVGISFGGMVAQELAVTWPERVERLALVCTSPGGTGADGAALSSYPLHELDDLPLEERVRVGREILDRRFTDDWLADHPSDRFIADVFEQRVRAPRTDEQRRGERLQLEARRHHDVLDRLPAISCPTLVAAGRYDATAPPANSEAIAARVPGAELRLYEGGHVFFFQDPTALPDIVGFLSGAP